MTYPAIAYIIILYNYGDLCPVIIHVLLGSEKNTGRRLVVFGGLPGHGNAEYFGDCAVRQNVPQGGALLFDM